MTIYRVEWYLAIEERVITRWLDSREKADEMYDSVRNALDPGSWICEEEWASGPSGVFGKQEVIHYTEI